MRPSVTRAARGTRSWSATGAIESASSARCPAPRPIRTSIPTTTSGGSTSAVRPSGRSASTSRCLLSGATSSSRPRATATTSAPKGLAWPAASTYRRPTATTISGESHRRASCPLTTTCRCPTSCIPGSSPCARGTVATPRGLRSSSKTAATPPQSSVSLPGTCPTSELRRATSGGSFWPARPSCATPTATSTPHEGDIVVAEPGTTYTVTTTGNTPSVRILVTDTNAS